VKVTLFRKQANQFQLPAPRQTLLLIYDDLTGEDKFLCVNPRPGLIKMESSGAKT